jgi:hypothetical protein
MSQEALVMIYYAYFHSVMNYGIICWDNSSYSINIFRLQKNAIRISTNSRSRDSCRDLFKTKNSSPSISIYIFFIMFCCQEYGSIGSIWIFMVGILDKVPVFIKLLLTCHFIKEVPTGTLWALRFSIAFLLT